MSGPAPHRDQVAGELPSTEQLCAAAMKCFAANGIEAGSLREVAKIAGVSVGFVQNRFGSKGALVEAVNERLVAILTDTTSTSPAPPPDPAAEWSQRAIILIAEQPDAIDYLGHLLLGDHPTGRAIFDQLVAIGTAQCQAARAQRAGADDLESAWDALNPLVLILGTLMLRSHIERQLPESIGSPDQRRKWESALDFLMESPFRDQPKTPGRR